MGGVVPRYQYGPVTFQVSADVAGGQLVEVDDAGKVKPATAGSMRVVGVASTDALLDPSAVAGSGSYASPLRTDVPNDYVAVWRGVFISVTFAADTVPGTRLIAAASGTVTPGGATPDAKTLVGYALDNVDVSENAKGVAFIF